MFCNIRDFTTFVNIFFIFGVEVVFYPMKINDKVDVIENGDG